MSAVAQPRRLAERQPPGWGNAQPRFAGKAEVGEGEEPDIIDPVTGELTELKTVMLDPTASARLVFR